MAGVNVTQSSGAAGAGAQIILRGGTSGAEGKDNQPLFVVDWLLFLITLHQWWAIRLSMVPCVLPLLLPIV